MSCYYYLIDRKNNLAILTGNYKNKEKFLEDVEIWEDFLDLVWDHYEEFIEIQEKEFKNLTARDIGLIMELLRKLPCLDLISYLPAVFYYIAHKKELELEVRSESELSKNLKIVD